MGQDGGKYHILSYQAGQPLVNTVGFSPPFPYLS